MFYPFVCRAVFTAMFLVCSLVTGVSAAGEGAGKIVLIGGIKSHGPGEHDFPQGIRRLEQLLSSSPDLPKGTSIIAFPSGWPEDLTVLDDATTVVWYFDGLGKHPLIDDARRTHFEGLMKKGVGLVTLHQSSTLLPTETTIELPRWLGAARFGMVDRTFQTAAFQLAEHPITRGVRSLTLSDEFYPTLRFEAQPRKVTPILTGQLTVKARHEKPIPEETKEWTVAWAWERAEGGRSFGFTGMHYVSILDNSDLRKLLLNAIVWTARQDVPAAGLRSTPRKAMTEAVVSPASEHQVLPQPWGRLTWYVSGPLRNSDTLTVGLAEIAPGKQNPVHYHPNCDEVLHVLEGHIIHSMNDRKVGMRAGDTVSIPAGVRHNAENIGTGMAKLAISFSSADRQVIGESHK